MKLKQNLLNRALAELVHYMANELNIEGGRTYPNGEPLEPERDARTIQLSDVARVIEEHINGAISPTTANNLIGELMQEFNEVGGVEENYVFKRYKPLEVLESQTGSTEEALKIIRAGKHRI